MHVGPEVAAEGDDIVDVVVEVEIAVGERHFAGIGPVGDVDVVLGEQRLDRATQQGGEVAAHRRHQQNLGVAPRRVAVEVEKVAERLAQQDLFVDLDVLVIDEGSFQAKCGLPEVLGEPRHDLGAGRDRLAEPGFGQGIVGAGVGLLEGIGPEPDGLGELPVKFVSMIKHMVRIVRSQTGLSLQYRSAQNTYNQWVRAIAPPPRRSLPLLHHG